MTKELKQEKKAMSFKLEDGKFFFLLDPNKDGEPVVQLMIDAAEIPDEIISLISSKGE